METLTDIERARLTDMRWRIQRGDYDSDRVPDTRLFRLATFLVSNAGALLGYCLLTGIFLAVLVAELLLLFG